MFLLKKNKTLFIKANKPVYIYCSFRSDVNSKIIDAINNLPKDIKIYLRDELSYKNFKNQTKFDCSYFPDFAYFAKPVATPKSMEIKEELEISRLFSDCLIGLNFSETSFRSFYKDLSDNSRRDYVESTIKILLKEINNPYLVLISHDTRSWENHLSDTDFREIAIKYLDSIGFTKYKVIPDSLLFTEILYFMPLLDTIITGRMHFSISAMINEVIPIVYTGKTHENNYLMIDKVKGMLINRLGDDSYAVSSQTELKNILHKFNNKEIPIAKLKKRISEVNKEDEKNYNEMKKILD